MDYGFGHLRKLRWLEPAAIQRFDIQVLVTREGRRPPALRVGGRPSRWQGRLNDIPRARPRMGCGALGEASDEAAGANGRNRLAHREFRHSLVRHSCVVVSLCHDNP